MKRKIKSQCLESAGRLAPSLVTLKNCAEAVTRVQKNYRRGKHIAAKLFFMRSTLDLPDPLMREALHRPAGRLSAPARSPAPAFQRENSNALPTLQTLSNAQLGALLDAEDAGHGFRGSKPR